MRGMRSPVVKKLFKHHNLIVCRLRNNLFSRLPHVTFSEIVQGHQLLNAIDCEVRGPKNIAPGGLVGVHNPTPLLLHICGALMFSVGASRGHVGVHNPTDHG
jgi:hypothetical protein